MLLSFASYGRIQLDECELKVPFTCSEHLLRLFRCGSLFGQKLRISNAPGSIQRLRAVFERCPELGKAVQKLDLSTPSNDWSSKNLNEIFKRSSGLLRSTPIISEISLVHVELTDKVSFMST